MPNSGSPYNAWAAITKSDTVDYPTALANGTLSAGMYVGTTGDVAAVTQNGVAVTFVGVPAGSVLPILTRRVNSTNTSAADMVALYVV